MLIGLLGEKYTGKDTSADYLVNNYGFVKDHHAKPLKDAAKVLFNFSDEQVNGSLKEVVDPRWGITPRQAMQFIGSLFRNNINDLIPGIQSNFWVNLLHMRIDKQLEEYMGEDLSTVVADVRFQNEVDEIKRKGGIVIKLIRDTNVVTDRHESEAGIVNITGFDYIIYNNGAKEELYAQLDAIMRVENV